VEVTSVIGPVGRPDLRFRQKILTTFSFVLMVRCGKNSRLHNMQIARWFLQLVVSVVRDALFARLYASRVQ
jgi:hypothetical protein